ncbi:ABC-F family ATP-binding cassette domain-containing protein [Propionibacteriaceae bacterium Y2011]
MSTIPRTPATGQAIVLDDVSFEWPDGIVVLDHLSCTFPPGRTGIMGANGSGKSTLLKLISGRLSPTSGSIHVAGEVRHLAQDSATDASRTVSDLLGISEVRGALARIEAGSVDVTDFDLVGDHWDVEEQAMAVLDRLDLPTEPNVLDRPATAVSGGQAMGLALAGISLVTPMITLLDEPTNNLDTRSRHRLYDQVAAFTGVLVVVSHDRDLLEHVDAIWDLDHRRPRLFGGPLSEYEEYRRVQQEVAERELRGAEATLKAARREAAEEETKLARRAAGGKRDAASGRYPKIVAGGKKRQAQQTAGRVRGVHAEKIESAERLRAEADATARTADEIRVDLPATAVPAGKRVLELITGGDVVTVQGPERIQLTGDNGAGKSTLLAALLGQPPAHFAELFGADVEVTLSPTVPVGHLSQRLEGLDEFVDPLTAVRMAAPTRTPLEARSLLATFLLRGDKPSQPMATLSGGERFRVALARMLFTEPAPQLLVLDEPTNNLDLASVDQLVQALADFRGALIVISHDHHLVADLHTTRRWHVGRSDGRSVLQDVPPNS